MGKRPYYILLTHIDYDGYDTRVDYIGTNWKAAYNRYRALIDIVKQEQFFDNDLIEADIEGNYNLDPAPLEPGHARWSYMNDQNDVYISIQLLCMNTNEFAIQGYERRYKERYPNSKY